MTRQNNRGRNPLFTPELKQPSRMADEAPKTETGTSRPGKITDLAKETREKRLRMHELVSQGYAEHHALAMVFPSDSNRRRQLRNWQQHGLWPIQSEELQQWRNAKNAVKDEVKEIREETPSSEPEEVETIVHSELETLVTAIVKREIKRQFDQVAISPIPKTGKTGKRAIKKAFSLPADLWEEVEKMFPGEVMSNVIAASIRMYINWKKELDQQRTDA
jgi:hypothetical protein